MQAPTEVSFFPPTWEQTGPYSGKVCPTLSYTAFRFCRGSACWWRRPSVAAFIRSRFHTDNNHTVAGACPAYNLKQSGWSLGWVSALHLEGRTIWIVDTHGYGKRFVLRADEMLTAFSELQRAIHEFAVSLVA